MNKKWTRDLHSTRSFYWTFRVAMWIRITLRSIFRLTLVQVESKYNLPHGRFTLAISGGQYTQFQHISAPPGVLITTIDLSVSGYNATTFPTYYFAVPSEREGRLFSNSAFKVSRLFKKYWALHNNFKQIYLATIIGRFHLSLLKIRV